MVVASVTVVFAELLVASQLLVKVAVGSSGCLAPTRLTGVDPDGVGPRSLGPLGVSHLEPRLTAHLGHGLARAPAHVVNAGPQPLEGGVGGCRADHDAAPVVVNGG